jgi:hypothetical protein
MKRSPNRHIPSRLFFSANLCVLRLRVSALSFSSSFASAQIIGANSTSSQHLLLHTVECEKEDPAFKIDDRLVRQAQKLGKHRTKKDAVTAALVKYIRLLKQQEIISLFGTIDYDPKYDYKRERQTKRLPLD